MGNKKIQLRAYPKFWMNGDVKEYVLEYRIVPKELNWFKRKFFNHWHIIHCAACYSGNIHELTINNQSKLYEYKHKFKTEWDIEAFENDQQIKANRKLAELESERKRKARIFY